MSELSPLSPLPSWDRRYEIQGEVLKSWVTQVYMRLVQYNEALCMVCKNLELTFGGIWSSVISIGKVAIIRIPCCPPKTCALHVVGQPVASFNVEYSEGFPYEYEEYQSDESTSWTLLLPST